MKKRKYTKKLSRNRNQRKALFRNLLVALFTHEKIETTKAKAKTIQRLAEKLITKGKKDTLHNRRLVHKVLQNKELVKKLFTDLAKRYKDISSSYTKIAYVRNRKGDDATIVRLSLTQPHPKQKTKSNTTPSAKPSSSKSTSTSKTSKPKTQSSSTTKSKTTSSNTKKTKQKEA